MSSSRVLSPAAEQDAAQSSGTHRLEVSRLPARSSALIAERTVGVQALIFPQVPVHLGQTLGVLRRGPEDPTFYRVRSPRSERMPLTDDALWIGARSTGLDIPLTLHFSRVADTPADESFILTAPVRVRLWAHHHPTADFSSGSVQAAGADEEHIYRELEEFASTLPQWLGLHDPREDLVNLPAFERLPTAIRRAYREYPGLRLSASGQLSKHVLAAILEQRVTQPEAFEALRWIAYRYGDAAPISTDPTQPKNLRVHPSSAVMGKIPSWDWHRARVDAARYRTVYHYASRAQSLEQVAASGRVAHLAAALEQVPGIGPWTVAEVLQRFCGHPDAVSVGDYHLAHTVGYAFTGKRTDDAGMLKLLASYAGHRQRIVRLLQEAGIRKPRYGARMSIPDYRDF